MLADVDGPKQNEVETHCCNFSCHAKERRVEQTQVLVYKVTTFDVRLYSQPIISKVSRRNFQKLRGHFVVLARLQQHTVEILTLLG